MTSTLYERFFIIRFKHRLVFGVSGEVLINLVIIFCICLVGGMDPYVLIQYKSQERKSSVAQGNLLVLPCFPFTLFTKCIMPH